ncbi:MAG TPA: hypothetical protein VMI09_02390 [Candidatus Binataceae bacterium]|nr:hypothetical protein [Candidatus Binataceae bacterium]
MDHGRRFSTGFGFDNCEPGLGNSDRYSDPNPNRYSDADPNSDRDSDRYSNCYTDPNSDLHADRDTDRDLDGDRHCEAHADVHARAGTDNAQERRDREYVVGWREPVDDRGSVRSGGQ